MRRLYFALALIFLTVLSPPLIYGSNKIVVSDELKKLHTTNKEILKKMDNIENQLGTIRNEYDALKLSVNAVSREARNSEKYVDNQLERLNWIIALIALVGIAGATVFYKYVKSRVDNEINKIPKKVEDEIRTIAEKYDTELKEISKVTTRFLDSLARLHNRMAYEEYKKLVKAPDETEDEILEKDKILQKMIEEQQKARENIEDAYKTDLEKLGGREKYILIEIWNNMAFYFALAEDRTQSAWAIEKARCAFEWGSGRRAFTPPKGVPIPLMEFVESYFYVLKTFDLPEFRMEWIKNYEVWKEALHEAFPEDPDIAAYDKYYEKIKGTGS